MNQHVKTLAESLVIGPVMAGRRVLGTAAVALTIAGGSSAAQTASQPPQRPGATFRSAVDLVSVAAVVRDRKGRFVSDLSSKDFIVVEAGERRPIVNFKAEDDGPVKLAILFDVSGSMRVGTKAVDAQQAARHLLGALKSTDQAALYSFDTKLQRVQDFTSDFSKLESALGHVDSPYGQTSLYDAIADTAGEVAKAAASKGRLQRAAVIVLTDGVDTHSRLTPAKVSGIASEIDIPVYVVAVMSVIDDPRTLEGAQTADAGGLGDLARWTGGELFTATSPAHASVAARQIVSELRHQYLLAFEASAKAGWRPLEVKARDRGLVVRARSGYTAGRTSADLTGSLGTVTDVR
jgi:Ca-activated chloride channel homolog